MYYVGTHLNHRIALLGSHGKGKMCIVGSSDFELYGTARYREEVVFEFVLGIQICK